MNKTDQMNQINQSSAFQSPTTDSGSTTNEGPLHLASPGSTARSDRPRLSSGGTMRTPARTGERLRPCPTAVHARRRARRTPVADREGSIGADREAHPARVHRRCAPQSGLATSCAQSSPSRSPGSRDSTRHASAARRASSTQPPPAPRASPRAQSADDPHPSLPIHLAPPQCHAATTGNPSSPLFCLNDRPGPVYRNHGSVCLVHLVGLVQPDRSVRPYRPNRPEQLVESLLIPTI